MMRCSVQPREGIFVKGYEFLSFAKYMSKNIRKNISKNLSGKYSPAMSAMLQTLHHAKKSTTDALKISSKRVIQKTLEATGGLIGNETLDKAARSYEGKITKVSKKLQQINSETVRNENDKEIPKNIYMTPEERLLII